MATRIADATGRHVVGALRPDSDEEDEEDLPPELRCCAHGKWLRQEARPAACLAWHDRLPPDCLDDLRQDAARLVMEHSRTFWLSEGTAPRCALEQVALSVLAAHRPSIEDILPRASPVWHECGVEWWVQHRRITSRDDPTPTIGFHWDTDENHKCASGEHVPPYLATVTYLGGLGAPTIILPLAADKRGRCVQVACGAFVSYPMPGKHTCFDGRLLHGAPHSLARRCTSFDHHNTRTTILVNLWIGHRPAGLRELPEELAARLSPVGPSASLRRLDADASAVVEQPQPSQEAASLEEAAVGYPFFHPPISMHGLPSPSDVEDHVSMVHVGVEELKLMVGVS